MDNGQTHSNYSPAMWFLGEQITGHACYVTLYQPAHEVHRYTYYTLLTIILVRVPFGFVLVSPHFQNCLRFES
jgi:hypothetical protein